MSQGLSSWWQPPTRCYLPEQTPGTSTQVPISAPAMINDRAPYSITLAPDGLSVDEVLHRLGCSPGWEVPDFEFITDWRQSPSPVPGVPTPDPRSTPSGKKDIQNTRTDANARAIRATEELLDEHSVMGQPRHRVRKTVENDRFQQPGSPGIWLSTTIGFNDQQSRTKRRYNAERTRQQAKAESKERKTGKRKTTSTTSAGQPTKSKDPNAKPPPHRPANGTSESSQIVAVQEVEHDLHGQTNGPSGITGSGGGGTPAAVFPSCFASRESEETPMDTMGSLSSPNQLGKRKRDEEVEQSNEESKERKEKRKREEINEYARSYLPDTFREVQRTPNLLLGCVHEMRRLQKKERDLEDRNTLLAGKLGRVREVLETSVDAEKGAKWDEEMRAHLLYIIDSPSVTE